MYIFIYICKEAYTDMYMELSQPAPCVLVLVAVIRIPTAEIGS